MRLYLLALNPTDSVTEGFLPAAARLGLDVTLLTDQPDAHRAAYPDRPGMEVLACDVRDHRAVITRISTHHRPDAVFTNSDHLQTQAALAAHYFDLPGKDWRAALRAKDKGEMRRHLAAAGVDTVWSAEITAVADLTGRLVVDAPYPLVVKPREGVASEDVVLVDTAGDLVARAEEILARRPGGTLVVEEYLPGELYTLETLGDGRVRHVLGGFHTELSPPPYFIEERLTFVPAHPEPVVAQVLAQLDALGVGFGACHTEFVVHEGQARIIEVNYRAIGDQCDLLLAQLLDVPLFEHILRTHLGEPLPDDLGIRRDGAARLEYPCADRAGTLVAAPAATDVTVGGVRLTYRPLRAPGEHHELYRTNRDYLGVLRATGTGQRSVDRAVADFLADRRWEIQP
ncbi:ATP-grasp domain-containing protein [Streptomyces caniscabiei]|uniref:ATP-grasp domain-containing protein n=1 Tax=Streptomyces caniscabiei TaxID=2746961 RepID=A0A927QH02_9ACTN|nr:ATP-grasp domain-containing protein [Streptomyces caniscabiei]MBD9725340.1 ATP-grasp domain-containing protein [Streptomyces caniscabiei]MDX3510890.1 ATP-grasp domain-containing protein [Streptomyces caniscabiei]MDX3720166.1 ATP-grasp domain-containing protein [Streptomyces caniscabiei]MDX3729350.1 ATP-grasp domain-containing protein [Streptomyces caniscabiei]WEO30276.1 ATP-grasp domain-containing protein [Streptomyces caniscabiei]